MTACLLIKVSGVRVSGGSPGKALENKAFSGAFISLYEINGRGKVEYELNWNISIHFQNSIIILSSSVRS
jgi:hypothetical protein